MIYKRDKLNRFYNRACKGKQGPQRIIIGGNNINIRYVYGTVFMADSERKVHNLLEIVAKESEKEGLTIKYKKRGCMVVSKSFC